MNDTYLNQVRFLINILNEIEGSCNEFALKGGTAINLFYQNLPRLSVDLDFAYIPIKKREQSFEAIENGLLDIKKKLRYRIVCVKDQSNHCIKLIVKSDFGNVKIEPNFVIRGSLENTEDRELCKRAQDLFETDLYFKCLSKFEVYSGKFIAALDRQHPRDLFDMKIFFMQFDEMIIDKEKFYESVLIYLLQSNRPLSELVKPHLLNIEKIYYDQFLGLTNIEISLEELLKTRSLLIEIVKQNVFYKYFEFIMSFMVSNPDWYSLSYYSQASKLPGIGWKLVNIKKMTKDKRIKEIKKLQDIKKCIENN